MKRTVVAKPLKNRKVSAKKFSIRTGDNLKQTVKVLHDEFEAPFGGAAAINKIKQHFGLTCPNKNLGTVVKTLKADGLIIELPDQKQTYELTSRAMTLIGQGQIRPKAKVQPVVKMPVVGAAFKTEVSETGPAPSDTLASPEIAAIQKLLNSEAKIKEIQIQNTADEKLIQEIQARIEGRNRQTESLQPDVEKLNKIRAATLG